MHTRSLLLPLGFTASLAGACATPFEPAAGLGPDPAPPELAPVDVRATGTVESYVAGGEASIGAFFGAPFPDEYVLRVLPDRAAFDASFPPEWGVTETECWMVAFGVADMLHVLAPAAWAEEACEHDPEDPEHVRGIVVHELVHVYHGQHNPTRDFTGMEPMGWFPEGLAVYVSGQLEGRHAGVARLAIDSGAAPERLEDAWSGEHRYGVAGSIVRYVDATWGRETLFDLLGATTEQGLLAELSVTEAELLAGWRAWVP